MKLAVIEECPHCSKQLAEPLTIGQKCLLTGQLTMILQMKYLKYSRKNPKT